MGEVDYNNKEEVEKIITRLTRERDAAVKEARELSRAIQNMGQPPLLMARVKRVLSKNYAIVHTPNYQEYLVPHPRFDLSVGDSVALNQNTLAIVKIIPSLTEAELQAKTDTLKEDPILDQLVNVILAVPLGLMQYAVILGGNPKQYLESVLEKHVTWRHPPSKST